MKSNLILVGILVILIIVVAALSLFLNSEISTLTSDYNSLKSSYSALYSNYTSVYNELESLNSTYYNLTSEYNTLANEYNQLHSDYEKSNTTYMASIEELMGLETAYKLFNYITSGNEPGIITYVTNSTQVFISQGKINGTITGLKQITSVLAEFYKYEFIRGDALELQVMNLGGTIYGEALMQYSNQFRNGSTANVYAVISLFLSYNGTGWYIAKLNIYNDLNQQTFSDMFATFSLIQNGIEAISPLVVNQYMIGQYPSYVYISTGPLAGNYSLVEFDSVLSKTTKFDFNILYYNVTPVSPTEISFTIYANITIELSNSSVYTYSAIITGYSKIQGNGLPEVTQLIINNSVQYSTIISDIQNYM